MKWNGTKERMKRDEWEGMGFNRIEAGIEWVELELI